MSESFYWRIDRDSLLTPPAIRLFQIVANYDGKEFLLVKDEIDKDYLLAEGRPEDNRHGGKIQSAIRVYQEAGWVELHPSPEGKEFIKVTDAGRQANTLLSKLPDFLKAVPFFIIELLARYQLNNPAKPRTSKNKEYDILLQNSDIFPYWTLWKIIRESGNYITADELKRFVFKIQKSEEIPAVIGKVKEYRRDKEAGLGIDDLDKKYSPEGTGAQYETKYIMGRLGIQVGKYPPVLEKEGAQKWVINKYYLPFIDEVLANEPIFKEHITENSWMAEHGKFVNLVEEFLLPPEMEGDDDEDDSLLADELPDDDPVWEEVKYLLESGASGVMFSGPPGTSKTWYASRIAVKLANKKARCVKQVQFHQSFNYDDFIEGYIPNKHSTLGDGAELFKVVDKIFLKTVRSAVKNPSDQYVIVIDEFTRGDASRIFGELLTYIEKDYRNKKFTLPYSGQTRSIPENIIVLGTMNPYDKSVVDLDSAMERRFEIISLEPSVELLKKLVLDAGMENELMGKVITFFVEANKKCPHGLGHTFFLNVSGEEDLLRLWNYKLRFIFEKMFRFEPHVYEEIREEYKKIISDHSKMK